MNRRKNFAKRRNNFFFRRFRKAKRRFVFLHRVGVLRLSKNLYLCTNEKYVQTMIHPTVEGVCICERNCSLVGYLFEKQNAAFRFREVVFFVPSFAR